MMVTKKQWANALRLIETIACIHWRAEPGLESGVDCFFVAGALTKLHFGQARPGAFEPSTVTCRSRRGGRQDSFFGLIHRYFATSAIHGFPLRPRCISSSM
jgi:hypothetical protein